MDNFEHFKDAGVDAIWMSPIFESPMIDFGYDISNFYEIHYEYGTMEDFENLLERAHELGKFSLDSSSSSSKNLFFISPTAAHRSPLKLRVVLIDCTLIVYLLSQFKSCCQSIPLHLKTVQQR